MHQTDIMIERGWVGRLPPGWRVYALLARWDRPIGTWLLLIPCWWALALAQRGWADLWLWPLFALGAVAMRGAGCTINDMWDRDIDARVARTRLRPLACGAIGWRGAWLFLVAQLAVGLVVLLLLPPFAIWLGLASLFLIAVYPLMKRVTWWPQLFLGLTFNWGALMGWAAVHDGLAAPALWLYAAGIFWTLFYDTIYAFQDRADDAVLGVKSTARLFGARARIILPGFGVLVVLAMAMAGASAGLGVLFYVGLAVTALHLAWQLRGWRLDDAGDCLRRFRSNRDFGLLVLLALIAGRIG